MLGHLGAHRLIHRERVAARQRQHGNEHRWLVVDFGARGVLECAELGAPDVAEPQGGRAPSAGADHDLVELLGIAEPAHGIDLHRELGAGRRRGLADLPRRYLDVLLGNRVLHVDGSDAELGELVRIEPHPHRVAPLAEDLHIADAGDALQRIDQLEIGVIAEGDEVDRAVGRVEIDGQCQVRVLLLYRDAALIDNRRQLGRRRRDPVLNIDGSDVVGIADIEADGNVRAAVIGTRRRHVDHSGHAVDLLLKRRGHGIGNDLCARSRICCGYDHLRRRHLGKLGNGQERKANEARQHHDDCDGCGENRPLDEEVHHGVLRASENDAGRRARSDRAQRLSADRRVQLAC